MANTAAPHLEAVCFAARIRIAYVGFGELNTQSPSVGMQVRIGYWDIGLKSPKSIYPIL